MTESIGQVLSLSRLRSRPGYVSVTVEYDVPDDVGSLTVTPPGNATVESAWGFDADSSEDPFESDDWSKDWGDDWADDEDYGWDDDWNDDWGEDGSDDWNDGNSVTSSWGGGTESYEWNGYVSEPELTFTAPVGDWDDDYGGYRETDQGSWALLKPPSVTHGWGRSRVPESGVSAGLDRTVELDDEGIVHDGLVYLGSYAEHTRFGGGEWFRLVVPQAARLRHDPEEILDALGRAAERMARHDVGGRGDEVVAVAAPARPVNWGPGGVTVGSDAFWARSDGALRGPVQIWLHEYVHTRQSFSTTAETRWLIEGTASYLAASLGHEQGLVSDAGLAWVVRDGGRSECLSSPDVWSSYRAPYERGGRIAGWLDAELAARADETLLDVLGRLNDHDEPVSHEDFLDACTEGLRWDERDGFADELDDYITGWDDPDPFVPRGVDDPGGSSGEWGDWSTVEGSTDDWLSGAEVAQHGVSVSVNLSESTDGVRITVEGGDVTVSNQTGRDDDATTCDFCGADVDGDTDRCPECGWTFGW